MIKSIQYIVEADQSCVLLALDLKAAFQNVSRRHMLHSLGQHHPDLATVFSRWYTGSTTHRMQPGRILRTNPGQQRNRPRMPTVTTRFCCSGRPHIAVYHLGNPPRAGQRLQAMGIPGRLVHPDQAATHPGQPSTWHRAPPAPSTLSCSPLRFRYGQPLAPASSNPLSWTNSNQH